MTAETCEPKQQPDGAGGHGATSEREEGGSVGSTPRYRQPVRVGLNERNGLKAAGGVDPARWNEIS